MSLEILPTDHPRQLRIVGELDLETAGRVADALGPACEIPEDLILDLSGMTFIDSSGIRVLLRAFRALRDQQAKLILRHPVKHVRELFDLLGLRLTGIVIEDGEAPPLTDAAR